MHNLVDLSWRAYPASALILLGAMLFLRGIARGARSHRFAARDARKALTMVEGFRLLLLGGSVAALGAGWMWHIGWLAILAIVIGAEETFETTLVRYGLTNGSKLRLRP